MIKFSRFILMTWKKSKPRDVRVTKNLWKSSVQLGLQKCQMRPIVSVQWCLKGFNYLLYIIYFFRSHQDISMGFKSGPLKVPSSTMKLSYNSYNKGIFFSRRFNYVKETEPLTNQCSTPYTDCTFSAVPNDSPTAWPNFSCQTDRCSTICLQNSMPARFPASFLAEKQGQISSSLVTWARRLVPYNSLINATKHQLPL